MIPPGLKVYFAVQPVDLRKSYDGLATLARSVLERDPAQGGMFVFVNRKGDQARVLFRDPHGWCLLSKRLDRGHFRRPRSEDGSFVWEAETDQLMTFLRDIDLTRLVARARRDAERHLKIVSPYMP